MNGKIPSCQWSEIIFSVLPGQLNGCNLQQRFIVRRGLIQKQRVMQKWMKYRRLSELEPTNHLCDYQEKVNDVKYRVLLWGETAEASKKCSHGPCFRVSSMVALNNETCSSYTHVAPYLFDCDDVIVHE
ncbi:unnamed protein product [Albugo candida]|uniref:Uncharacterized protein n=1 Tax=Albugo candida TaxID=65357 RepID=A0A024FT05_9STRA|nr:unnamed protein product [Albugo candida]|eukprot:CCI10198.1 unnamed protein product [Albugo candida]